ncbi:Xylose isomerase domain protein TIM barrel [Citreicella sp. 357]|nr:Xylose isomerase domain protein TIM barrel [Citreicella sp. 357]
MTTMTLPVIGAALPVDALPEYRDWLFDKDRDLEVQSFHDPELLRGDGWRDVAERARDLLAGFNGRLGIHGPFVGLSLNAPDPDVRAIVTRRLMTGLDACGVLDARQMVVHSPYTTWDHHNLDSHPGVRDDVIAQVHATLASVVRRAEDQGVTLVMENIEDVDPAERLRLVDSFGSDALKLSIDTGHAHYAHGITRAGPVDHVVRAAGAGLAHVHLQDADGYADRHWAIGRGTIRWHEVFRALADLPQRPHLVLELRDVADVRPSMRWLEAHGLGQ